MYDAIGDFRSHCMEKIRDVVETHYCFGDPRDHRETVATLLHHDSFALEDINNVSSVSSSSMLLMTIQGNGKRFLSPVIVKAIAKCFFQATSREALGRLAHTASSFRPLHGSTVIFVTSCIHFALSEYETGKRVPKKFEGAAVDGMRFTNGLRVE